MRFSTNWLKTYVKLPKSLADLTDKLTLAGHLLDKIEASKEDTTIDLELRGNRADCYSLLGMAKEISVIYKTPLKYPSLYQKIKKVPQLPTCKNNIKTPLVKRVVMVAISNVKIGPSPNWMKRRLASYGITPINNIVDLTNYVMLEIGEPMHAFDLDQIGRQVEIRLAKTGEKMTTFAGEKLRLTNEDLVWANRNSVLSVAGAIGEKYHSISQMTKTILVEAASYDRANIRRSIYRHQLLTDAGIRHEKELDPNLVETAIKRFLYLLQENRWGKIIPSVFDYYPKPVTSWPLTLNYARVAALSGITIKKNTIKDILSRLGFEIVKESQNTISVLVPTIRTDVTLEEDLIEEILRIVGYEQIPSRILALEVPQDVTLPSIKQELEIKNILLSLGFDETINLPFVKEASHIYNHLLESGSAQTVTVTNPPSPDIREMRMSLFPGLLEYTQKVINERGEEVRFFEIGKIYCQASKKYFEKRRLGIIYWTKRGANFMEFRGFLDSFFSGSNLPKPTLAERPINLPEAHESYDVFIKGRSVGTGFAFRELFYCEINLDAILSLAGLPVVSLWPKYPPQIEDLTLSFPEKTKIGNVVSQIEQASPLIRKVELKDIYKDAFGEALSPAYTFRICYQNPEKTLTDKEVESIRNQILAEVKKKFGGGIKG